MIKNRIKDVYDHRMNTETLEDFLKEFTVLQNSFKPPFKNSKLNSILRKIKAIRKNQNYQIEVLKEFKEEVLFEDKCGVSEYSEDFLNFKSFVLQTFNEDLATINSAEFSNKQSKTSSKLGEANALNLAFNEKPSISSFFKEKQLTDQNIASKTEEQSSYSLTPNRTISTFNAKKIERYDTAKESVKRTLSHNTQYKTKVLPGGKYGLALYIKYFGFPQLRELSFGKILSLINKGVQINLIEHIKVGG
jgi:hypothetical protein